MRISITVFFTILSFLSVSVGAQTSTFTNPLLPSGADPWVIQKDGWYYYTNSTGTNITLWKTRHITDLGSAQKKVVWTPPAGTNYSRELWAPELHFINKKWYVYFAADDGINDHHRIYVLENSSADPLQGAWIFKGKVADPTDKWAIDASVFTSKGQLYMIWSGWEGDTNGEQDIFIAKLKNPWTVDGERVKLSYPTFDWEKNGDLHDASNPPHVNVNEGPELLKHGDKLFLIYSASGCWTDFYALGMLTVSANSNLLKPASWTKSRRPVFKQSPQNGVYAPGHNSFFKSPDGKEDWILYHANSQPGQGCGKDRSPRAQKFTWNKDGSPNFGIPVKQNMSIPLPSGTN
ncbi:glycoside hydrolase family 43 protein [Mucilaginibacter ginsenosidivorans]|uniref:Family 43 glycosylhydrolase n=1 Tax=Mucilaginibacter ginsenosidivorans TaxID=398053 RepID=A0A5B8UZF3_9SPHI|nr:glycoside hydrolase family 43 protein [Mucilaginibacter ginsenosidivorans]QEC64402.1 family 43 glycosylhydrolase [Mucilaginibacter ginsenosidivorans]